jgi:hypothetical protein
MPLPTTPRSRTLAALSVARGTYMDQITVRKWHITMMIFVASWFIFYITFDSFHPGSFLSSSDYLHSFGIPASDSDDLAHTSDNVLSDQGRAVIWGASLGFGALVAFIYYFFYVKLV